ncbi:MAG: M48 family peptidase, partial [Candidatus Omnitrophica bacterium]|nr:M48 family peptidase [Candidatus Omnitrophota bacterium]
MNVYLVIILVILIGEYFLDLIVENLNVRRASPVLPEEFAVYYDADKYKKSQDYLKENTRFKLIKSAFFTSVILAFILAGGFNFADKAAGSFNLGPIFTGLIFAGMLMLAVRLL